MADQAQRTAWALDQFDGFVGDWTPPAMLPHLIDTDDNAAERVRRAIRAIAPGVAASVVGYAVFEQVPDRERECGFEHVAVSAVMETLAQAENARDYCIAKDKSEGGRKYFAICGIQQIPT